MKREELNFYLQQAPVDEVILLTKKIEQEAEVKVIQTPTRQTLLVPVEDPITGGMFYGGELLGTSTIVQVNTINGWAMVMDEDMELSQCVATLDAAFAAEIHKHEIVALAAKGRENYTSKNNSINQQVEDTRVSFDLM